MPQAPRCVSCRCLSQALSQKLDHSIVTPRKPLKTLCSQCIYIYICLGTTVVRHDGEEKYDGGEEEGEYDKMRKPRKLMTLRKPRKPRNPRKLRKLKKLR